jgi:hypothetical protein
MEDTSEKSQWAFDCRPWEGGRWNDDLPDEEMKTKYPQGKMVHIGIKEEWDPSETGVENRGKYGSWTRPLIPGAEKAKWGTTQESKYLCCDDLDNCGVVCIVAQGEQQSWNFRRQSPERRLRKPNRCINQRKWFGESMYHNLTKRHVARTLDLATWKEEFGIESVHLEQQITFDRENESVPLQPDIHVVLQGGDRLYIEVVYKNPPKRLHHDLYGEGLAIIDLRDEANRVVLSSDDEEERIKSYRSWVREGGIEEALREELAPKRRQELFQRRQENFERNNITVVRDYLSEIGDEPDTKWHLLSEESIDDLEHKIEEGMSKDMVRVLYLDVLERQRLDENIQNEIDRLSDVYDTSGYTAKQFDSVEEVSPFIKQDFVDMIEAEIKIQREKHGFDIEFHIDPKHRKGWPVHHEVGSPQKVRDAYKLEAPMRKKQFAMHEESGFELNIQFQEGQEEVAVKGAEFYASTAKHITEIYEFTLPILEEKKRCKEDFGFDANLEYTRFSLALDTILDDESPDELHWIVKGANEVQMAYETEKQYRDESLRRSEEWPRFLAQIKKECEEILNPRLEEIRKHIKEQKKSEKIVPNNELKATLNGFSRYQYYANTPLEHGHKLTSDLEGTLPNYQSQLDDKCPHVLLHRDGTHKCFNLEFLGFKDLLVQLDEVEENTLTGERYKNSPAAKVVDSVKYLRARESFFQKLSVWLNAKGKDWYIGRAEAERRFTELKGWNSRTRIEKIDWCIERGIHSEDDLLKSMELTRDTLCVERLSNLQLCKKYWELNPLDQTEYFGGSDPLYKESRSNSDYSPRYRQ